MTRIPWDTQRVCLLFFSEVKTLCSENHCLPTVLGWIDIVHDNTDEQAQLCSITMVAARNPGSAFNGAWRCLKLWRESPHTVEETNKHRALNSCASLFLALAAIQTKHQRTCCATMACSVAILQLSIKVAFWASASSLAVDGQACCPEKEVCKVCWKVNYFSFTSCSTSIRYAKPRRSFDRIIEWWASTLSEQN